ncbi:sigma-54 interaction domain-containing protein [Desulfitobacterium sp.]|uniref:sigma-54 interaction domain-containing protein n=1 Tax=Desulfitobacterium sp. TaxID=49981 RepID=UPI002C5E4318|nr:sigma 54-interacting transcriptional regulator [Desulfitobacterium sp.]HVJ48313.1 sigma 54-interacting transcriptional regulator [Desulfitobacterium sp.]
MAFINTKTEDSGVISSGLRQKGIVANSGAMFDIVRLVNQIAPLDCTVLILGESGVGKEIVAKLIHENSAVRDGPFIKVNCGAIPENLLESEFFGYEYGAFTGAQKNGMPGKFELAHNGTILLDEIGDLPLHLQVKLLRVLQDHEVVRIGGNFTRTVNIRVIAATNRNLAEMVQQGNFREDLYYRLNVVPLWIPPLKERREDIMPLIRHFKRKFQIKYGIERNCSSEVTKVFQAYDWPGNVRELENTVERLYVMPEFGTGITADILVQQYLNSNWMQQGDGLVTIQKLGLLKQAVKEVEKKMIIMAIERFGTAKQAATFLGIDESTLSRKLRRH